MRDITRQMRLQEWAAQVEDWKRSGLTQRQWAKAHGMTLEGFKYRRFKDESNYNFVVGDVTFDYVQRDDDRMLFVKIWDDLEQTRGPEDWEKIQEAVASVNKIYNSEILLCSLRRFREAMWEYPRNFRNLHLMEARNMITCDETWDLINRIRILSIRPGRSCDELHSNK